MWEALQMVEPASIFPVLDIRARELVRDSCCSQGVEWDPPVMLDCGMNSKSRLNGQGICPLESS